MKKIWVSLLMIALTLLTISSAQASAIRSSLPQVQGHVHSAAASPLAVAAANIGFGCDLTHCFYSPANVMIKPGENVAWQGDFTMHPLVSDDGLWTTVNTGTQFEFIFNTPGIYHFHCMIHGAFGMVGIVAVGFGEFLPEVTK